MDTVADMAMGADTGLPVPELDSAATRSAIPMAAFAAGLPSEVEVLSGVAAPVASTAAAADSMAEASADSTVAAAASMAAAAVVASTVVEAGTAAADTGNLSVQLKQGRQQLLLAFSFFSGVLRAAGLCPS
jgi:hypothetical protein